MAYVLSGQLRSGTKTSEAALRFPGVLSDLLGSSARGEEAALAGVRVFEGSPVRGPLNQQGWVK